MKIEKIEIRDFKIGELCSKDNDGICHIKVLPYLSIVQATEGCYTIKLNNSNEYNTGEGGAFIAPSQVTQTIIHNTNKKSGQMSARWVFLDVIINYKHKLDFLYNFPPIIPESQLEQLNMLFNNLFNSDNLCDNMSICYQFVKLLIHMAEEKSVYKSEKLSVIIDYIENNYKESISVSQLAALINMSESNFYAVFKKAFCKSPIAYLNDYRLSVASVMLKHTDKTIGEIAEAVGINDQLYFSKLFKEKYLVSPRKYKNSNI